jgi:predicted Na+-dependent transporter
MNRLPRLLPDIFTLAILGVVVLALMLPCGGEIARLVAIGSDIAIALLFFLQVRACRARPCLPASCTGDCT